MEGNIIVTGGAGYVGYSVVKTLAEKFSQSKIIIYDNLSKGRIFPIGNLKNKLNNITVISSEKADIRDEDNFEKVLELYKPTTVIHLAAIVDAFTTNREGKDLECMNVNYKAAVDIAKLSKKKGVRKFIFQCSVSLYSVGSELKEDDDKEPISTYGKSKLLAEKEILELNDLDFKTVSLRPATVVGYNPSFRYETIINLLCARAIYKIPTFVFESALKQNKTYLDVQDNTNAIVFSLENIEKLQGQVFNLTSFHTNLEEVIDLIKENLDEDFPYLIVKNKTVNQQVYTINSDKLKSFGFKPQGEIRNVIKTTISGLKKYNDFFNKFS